MDTILAMSGELLLMRKALGLGHEKASFFVASFLWGISLIMLLAGYLAERYGHKKILIAGASLALLSSLLLTFSQTFMEILTGRFLMGIATGMLSITTPTYLSETTCAAELPCLFKSVYRLAFLLPPAGYYQQVSVHLVPHISYSAGVW